MKRGGVQKKKKELNVTLSLLFLIDVIGADDGVE